MELPQKLEDQLAFLTWALGKIASQRKCKFGESDKIAEKRVRTLLSAHNSNKNNKNHCPWNKKIVIYQNAHQSWVMMNKPL